MIISEGVLSWFKPFHLIDPWTSSDGEHPSVLYNLSVCVLNFNIIQNYSFKTHGWLIYSMLHFGFVFSMMLNTKGPLPITTYIFFFFTFLVRGLKLHLSGILLLSVELFTVPASKIPLSDNNCTAPGWHESSDPREQGILSCRLLQCALSLSLSLPL